MTKKLIQFFKFLFISIILSGLYGIVHNQFTFTISSEYFTHLKFLQFGLPDYFVHPERLGAAVVGWASTWWVGLFIGPILGLLWIGKNQLTSRDRYRALRTVFLTAITFGIMGAIFAYFYYQPERYYEVFKFTGYGKEINDSLNLISEPYAFLRAGTIHNSSYFGGLIGLILGILRLWKSKQQKFK